MPIGKDFRDQVQDGGAEEQASTKGKQPLKPNRVRGTLVYFGHDTAQQAGEQERETSQEHEGQRLMIERMR